VTKCYQKANQHLVLTCFKAVNFGLSLAISKSKKPQGSGEARRLKMSAAIKTILFSFIILSTQIVFANELKVLSVKEFIQKKDSLNFEQESLNDYEINNDELVVLTKIESDKKKQLLSKTKSVQADFTVKL
jgi:hypothetical protein